MTTPLSPSRSSSGSTPSSTMTGRRRDVARETLRSAENGGDVDVYLVTDLHDIRYLTGFTGSNAAVALAVSEAGAAATRQGDMLATDGRYLTQSADQAPDMTLIEARQCPPMLVRHLLEVAPKGLVLGAQATNLTHADWTALEDVLGESESGEASRLVPLDGVIAGQRELKDETERDSLRAAAIVARDGLTDVLREFGDPDAGTLRPGISERALAAAIDHALALRGSERPSFDTIVATGVNGARPHHEPSDAVLVAGELVTIDYGATVNGYASDTTRTFAVGSWEDLDATAREIYAVTLRAHDAALDRVTRGAMCVDLDTCARDIIAEAGYGDAFSHSLGHGVGLDVHETPLLSYRSKAMLEATMVVTIEPGIYLGGQCGVRIEDAVIVTDGAPEVLPAVPIPPGPAGV